MGYSIAFPNITGGTNEAQLSQIKEYLFRLTNTLNFALSSIEREASGSDVVLHSSANSTGTGKNDTVPATFGELRDFIIKSADIVAAYSEMIQKRLKYEYVAQSDYGAFINNSIADITARANLIAANFLIKESVSQEDGEIKKVDTVTVNGAVKVGEIKQDKNGYPVIGVAIGQTTDLDGESVFSAAIEITSDRISFKDAGGNEVAHLSNNMLYISRAEITDFLRLGEYDVDVSDGVVFKWRGE